MTSDMTASDKTREVPPQWEVDAAALAELMSEEIARPHPHALAEAQIVEIRLNLLARLRDASVMRRFALVNADEPAFALALGRAHR